MTTDIQRQHRFSLQDYNSFGLAATAESYIPVVDARDLTAVKHDPVLSGMPRLILGGGSNLVLTRDVPGLVLHMRNRGIELIGEDVHATYVRAAAGENWHELVLWTLAHDLPGLENLSLIPGSVGASPVQNIGAYGVELKDRLHSVTVFDFENGQFATLSNHECRFAYRDSVFKHELRDRAVIVDVTFALPRHWQPVTSYADVAQALAARDIENPSARQISEAVIDIRRRKLPDPAQLGNAGSFFKNPIVSPQARAALLARNPQLVSYVQPDGSYKLAAGWLIDQCGWKGRSLGRAGVYEKQALVLVNRGGASGQEVARLAQAIQDDVKQHFGVELEPEPIFI